MHPGGENHAAGPRFHLGDDLVQVIVQGAGALLQVGDLFGFQINPDGIQGEMIPHPLQAGPGGLLLGDVVVTPRHSPHDAANQRADVGHAPVNVGDHPARSADVDMRIVDLQPAGAEGDHREVAAAPEDGNPRRKPHLRRGAGEQFPHLLGGTHHPGKMLHLDIVGAAQGFAPFQFTGAGIEQKGHMGGVVAHGELPRAAQHQVILDIQPFVGGGVHLRLVVAHPEVLPERVFCAGRPAAGDADELQHFEQVHAVNAQQTGVQVAVNLGGGAGIDVVHRVAQGVAVPIHGDVGGHLGAERHAADLRGGDAALREHLTGGGGDRLPPLVHLLLRAPIRQEVDGILADVRGDQIEGLPHAVEAGLVGGGADVVNEDVHDDWW